MTITVGVVIPVYNRNVGLHSAINSVLAQDRLPEQIVVVDDASTVPIDLSNLERTNNLELIRFNHNLGPAAARQAGVEALSTTHVAFLDSDDCWEPRKISAQVSKLEELGANGKVAMSCGWRFLNSIGETDIAVQPAESSELRDFVSGCWYCPGSTALMSRQMILEIGGFDTRLRRLEDLDLFIRYAQAGGRLEVAPILGASIKRGRNAKMEEVRNASNIIRMKYSRKGSAPLDAQSRRFLLSWLALECAAAARNEERFIEMSANLLMSFILVPRTQLQLKSWLSEVPLA